MTCSLTPWKSVIEQRLERQIAATAQIGASPANLVAAIRRHIEPSTLLSFEHALKQLLKQLLI